MPTGGFDSVVVVVSQMMEVPRPGLLPPPLAPALPPLPLGLLLLTTSGEALRLPPEKESLALAIR